MENSSEANFKVLLSCQTLALPFTHKTHLQRIRGKSRLGILPR